MINEQLKEKFVNAIKNTKPDDDGKIKLRFEVSEYLEGIDNNETLHHYLLENIEEATREVNSTYVVGQMNIGRDDISFDEGLYINKDKVADMKNVVCEVTIICGSI